MNVKKSVSDFSILHYFCMSITIINITFANLNNFAKPPVFAFDSEQLELVPLSLSNYLEFCH